MDRVVIVEDHELLASSLALALRQLGLEVETVAGPTVADVVGAVRRLAPVLVLLDLHLGPRLGSGLDLIGPLMAAGGRVVMMTGEDARDRLGACIEAGAAGVVRKTAGLDELVEAIRQAAAGEDLLTTHQRQILLAELQTRRQADHRRLAPFTALSPREQAVLAQLVAGDSAETIARVSYVSLATVRSQIHSILNKLGVKSQLAAVALARTARWPEE
jgi:DNA-binding NarL/FixJ family response regulator